MLRRRYEILLPLRHNDGRPVSDEKLNQTREELVNQFDGISVQPQSILGIWCTRASVMKIRLSG
jgi:hypothetical protein